MMRDSRRLLAVAVLAGALTVLATGCPRPASTQIEGRTWILDPRDLGTPPPGEGVPTPTPDRPVTLVFEQISTGPSAGIAAGRVSGSAGCNSYFGTYDRNGSRLSIREIGSTDMACDPNTMRLEQAYLARLGNTAAFRATATTLSLIGADGTPLLTFTAGRQRPPTTVPTTTSPVRGPVGTWLVTQYLSDDRLVGVEPGSPVTLTLEADGQLRGRACNIFGGTWGVSGDMIRFHAEWMTEMACTTPGTMDQEQWFLRDLAAATRWSLDEGRAQLTLSRMDGTVVITAALPVPG